MKLKSRALGIILLAFTLLPLLSCSEEEETNVGIFAPQIDYPLIPADTATCYDTLVARGTGTIPDKSIKKNYLSIPNITIVRKDSSKPLTISYIRIFTEGDSSGPEEVYDGDKLMALKSSWWQARVGAGIDANVDKATTDCPLYLGEFSDTASFVGSVTIEARGYEGTLSGGDQPVPFRVRTTINVLDDFN